MVYDTLETFTYDELEAFTYDELEMIYFSDSLAIADAAPVMAVGKSLADAMELDTPYLSVSAIFQGATEATLTTESGADVGFSGGDAVVVFDSMGFDKHGYVDGVPASTSIDVDDGVGASVTDIEKVGVHADLNGTSQFFYRSDADFPESGITGTNDLTIELWINPDDLSGSHIMVGKWGPVDQRMYVFQTSDDELLFAVTSSGLDQTVLRSTNANLVIGEWYHVAVVYDASAGSASFYRDGGLLTDDATGLSTSIFDGNPDFIVAATWVATSALLHVDGAIANVALFDDIRTPAEILASATDRSINLSGEGNIIGQWQFWEAAGATEIDNTQGDAGRDLIPYDGGDVTFSGLRAQEAFIVRNKVVFDIGKPLSDVFSMSESKVFDIGKNVAESLTFSETFAKAVGMNVTESFSMSESPAFDFYKVLDDTQTIIETFVAGTRLFVSELFSISDSVAFAQTYGRVFGETMAIVDSVVMLSGKNVADNMAISDAFASVASMYRSFTDAEPLSDALVVSISKVLSDIFSSSDDIFKSLQIGEQLASQKDIAALLADPRSEVRPWMPWVAIGASDIEGNELYDTALWDELHRKLGDVSVTANTYFVRAAFGQDEPTADDLTIYEIGIFDAATGGVMGKRWVLNTGVDKDNVDEIVVECAVTILHGNIEEARVLFNLAPGADAIVEDNITQQPVDVQSMSDSISFVLNKNVSFSDNMAISDSIVTAHDMNRSFSDNMAMVDGSPPPPVITVLDSLLAGGGCVNGLDLDEVKGVLYVANASGFLGSGLYVYDVSDPTNLANVGYAGYPLGVTSSANDVVIIDSNYVAQVSFNNVDIFDVSDPINPFHVVTVSVVGAPRRLQYRDNYVYTANGNAAHGISVVDVTNRAASVEIWNSVVDAGLDIGGVNDVWVEGNYLYAGDGSVEGVSVFDIADPTNPVLVGQVDVAVRRMMALGNYLYVARSETFPSSGRGLKIIDISDPTNPTLVNTVETVDIAFSLFVHSKGTRTYVHVGNWSADLWSTIKPVIEIFDVSDPLNVKQLATEEFGFVLPGDGRYKGFEDMIVNSDGTVLFGGESRTQLHAVDVSDTSGTLISMAWVCAQYLS